MKAAFVHIVKSGGMYLLRILSRELLARGYELHDIPSRAPIEEIKIRLGEIARGPGADQLLHHHSNRWPEDGFTPFKANGWFTFSFVRHPGDLLCSYYHYSTANPDFVVQGSLDEFIKKSLSSNEGYSLAQFGIPPYWRQIDFIAPFSHSSLARFFKTYFQLEYRPEDPFNVSANQGYACYCREGLISAEAQQMLQESEQFQWYREICSRGLGG